MPVRPTDDEIRRQLDRMKTVPAFAKLKNGKFVKYTEQGGLFSHIIEKYLDQQKEEGSWPTGTEMARAYVAMTERTSISDTACRKRMQAVRDSVDLYYYRLPETAPDEVIIVIPHSDAPKVEPGFTYRKPPISNRVKASPGVEAVRYLGNNISAMKEFIQLAKLANQIEDTTVRWQESAEQLKYPAWLMEEFSKVLRENSQLVFKSITGPVVDNNFTQALVSAYKSTGSRFEGWRLLRTSPLMNFTIFYFPSSSGRKTTVFFGYGKNSSDFSIEKTAVFSTEEVNLVKEYRRLFEVLRNSFSRPIRISDPDFSISRERRSDILVSFSEWPGEIAERMANCHYFVKVCVAGWSQLATYADFLRTALGRGKKVTVTLWDTNDPFILARMSALYGQQHVIDSNNLILHALEKEFKGMTIVPGTGWASASIFWIDEDIYFGLYWADSSTLTGPYFMCRAESTTGRYLQSQYAKMIGRNPTET